MTNTHRCHFFHIVWSTKNRQNLILPKMQTDLYAYMGGIIRKTNGNLLEIGGIANHVHLLVEISNLNNHEKILRATKAGSSSWLKSQFSECQKFSWQDGYGSFSVNVSMLDITRKYIQNQEKHHEKITYEDEYVKFLATHKIPYDLKYVFD